MPTTFKLVIIFIELVATTFNVMATTFKHFITSIALLCHFVAGDHNFWNSTFMATSFISRGHEFYLPSHRQFQTAINLPSWAFWEQLSCLWHAMKPQYMYLHHLLIEEHQQCKCVLLWWHVYLPLLGTDDDMIVGVALLPCIDRRNEWPAQHVWVVAHIMNILSWEWWQAGILCDEDISLLVCGEEVMHANPHITSQLNWHITDTGNYGKSVLPFCIDVHHVVVPIWDFYEHDIKLHSVLHVGKIDLRGCSMYIVGGRVNMWCS